jgi:hypothetical protein
MAKRFRDTWGAFEDEKIKSAKRPRPARLESLFAFGKNIPRKETASADVHSRS